MEDTQEQIIQKYSTKLAQTEYDKIFLEVQVEKLQEELETYKAKEKKENKEEIEEDIIQEVDDE